MTHVPSRLIEFGRLIGTIGPEEGSRVHPATPLWQAMSPRVAPIHESATALEALAEMGRRDVPRLVVTDGTGQLVGLISQSDLMRAVRARMAGFQVAHGDGTIPVQVQRATPAGPFAPPPPVGYTPPDAPRDPQRYARPL